jgi:hypothetical protein
MECHVLPSQLGHEICNIKYLKLDVNEEMSNSTTIFGEKW